MDAGPALEQLLRKAIKAEISREPLVAADERIRPPRLLGRVALTSIVSQLFHAERMTERMCTTMAGRVSTPTAASLLIKQAEDECRHADLYRSYLCRIGDVHPVDDRIAEALDAMTAMDLGPEAIIAAYHVVLEGEAVKLQQDCVERFSCPALKRITRAIGHDEARHVAFGHAYLNGAFAQMSQDRRIEIYRHIRRCWMLAAGPTHRSGSLMHGVLARKRRNYIERRWHHHDAVLARLGLVRPEEAGRE